MTSPSRKSWRLIGFGLFGLLWFALTLVALVDGIRGGHLLFAQVPGNLVLPQLSLFGEVYLVLSALMPFVVILAIALT